MNGDDLAYVKQIVACGLGLSFTMCLLGQLIITSFYQAQLKKELATKVAVEAAEGGHMYYCHCIVCLSFLLFVQLGWCQEATRIRKTPVARKMQRSRSDSCSNRCFL